MMHAHTTDRILSIAMATAKSSKDSLGFAHGSLVISRAYDEVYNKTHYTVNHLHNKHNPKSLLKRHVIRV
jgi:hypothetical protein